VVASAQPTRGSVRAACFITLTNRENPRQHWLFVASPFLRNHAKILRMCPSRHASDASRFAFRARSKRFGPRYRTSRSTHAGVANSARKKFCQFDGFARHRSAHRSRCAPSVRKRLRFGSAFVDSRAARSSLSSASGTGSWRGTSIRSACVPACTPRWPERDSADGEARADRDA